MKYQHKCDACGKTENTVGNNHRIGNRTKNFELLPKGWYSSNMGERVCSLECAETIMSEFYSEQRKECKHQSFGIAVPDGASFLDAVYRCHECNAEGECVNGSLKVSDE